jgi:putative oxidoreductase
MNAVLGSYSSYIYALLRIVTGFMFMLHGTQKLLGFPARLPNPCQCPPKPPASEFMSTLLTVGGVIEVVAGLLILIGLFAGIAAFISSGMMAIAYFMSHQPGGPLPIQNGGELAVIYCFVFLYIGAVGSGAWSVDALLRKGKT